MQAVLVFHNILRWAVLFSGVWTLVNAISGVAGRRAYSANDNKSNLFFMICCDIQLLLGLTLYFSNSWFDKLKTGGAAVMKNPGDRFFSVEHAVMMIIAWILVHAGRTAVKKASSDTAKHKKMLLFFGLALFLILASIPWPFREAIGRPLYRWFN